MGSLRFEGSGGGMPQAEFDAGISLLLTDDIPNLRGERGPDRPQDNGPDNRGGEPVEMNPHHRYPPGLGGVGLTKVSYDRDRDSVAA